MCSRGMTGSFRNAVALRDYSLLPTTTIKIHPRRQHRRPLRTPRSSFFDSYPLDDDKPSSTASNIEGRRYASTYPTRG